MSQVKLNLQPPPNVDFVTGYPGIPPGPDRPQASVRGAIEVRVPQQGVKVKWVRIELRKVETLPGGGPSNTFYDFVGPSPVNLWSTSDEYSLLRSQDFPFSIRIPESIPPTIALDNKAGIGYELVASVCTKVKRGFLRKAKSVVVSEIAPIIIDKHELHATWPVYCQPEKRHATQDGVTLIVDRNTTCYGPGDRVSVTATVKSDSLHTVILRGFEFFLKETTVFRGGAHAAGRKNTAPQTRQAIIGETKVPINLPLFGGQTQSSDLSFMISPNHTTTTLNAARHIDVNYVLCIKALMGTGSQIIMDLPVIISNWQRTVSFEAINRIGPAPGLSLIPQTQPQTLPNRLETSRRPSDIVASTLPTNRANIDYGHVRGSSAGDFNSLPGASSTTAAPKLSNDGLGYGAGFGLGRGVDDFGTTKPALSINPSLTSTTTGANTTTVSGRGAGATPRLQLKNVDPQESISRNRSAQATGSSAAGGSTSLQNQWPSAEEEKRRYENARNNVAKVQGPAAAPPPISMRPESSAATSSAPRGAAAAVSSNAWLSAEEEKRLFQQAQTAVLAKQGIAAQGPQITQTQPSSGSSSSKLTGPELYAQAVNARSGSSSAQAGGSSSASAAKPPVIPVTPQYMTAEQEKAALRRYEEAKRAVDRTQNADEIPPSHPIAYDSLYPAAKPAPTASSSQPINDAPPSFEAAAGGSNIMAHLSEKERLRRKYEAEDAAASAAQQRAAPPPAAYTPPVAAYAAPPPAPAPTPAPAPAPASSLPGQYASALEEKEAARRRFAARDAQFAKANATPTATPPPAAVVESKPPSTPPPNGVSSSPGRSPNGNTGFRPTPLPPANAQVLTAAEEKALLKAKMEARDAGRKPPTNGAVPPAKTNGLAPQPPALTTTPPPLMPRPPVEYIKETQEEDARLSKLNGEHANLGDGAPKVNGALPPSGAAVALDMKPFTPFRAGFDTTTGTPGPPPPLPSKPAGE
ncbi:hypothetical protein BDN70DRAFT_885453 [Pholiota conissans]|uniref:Arrestin C-terminal-like domain-containing protein n=1 Tax=Pholiota conissans TaxID=109636 RepID=A0A9P6CPE6_9AGAR|nr:hypothetical protein BDN70DRAFT_885453 [Pholiota conissans]